MPNRDGTGPEGKGAKTGREMGTCEGAEPRGRGQGFGGRGCGRGRKCQNWNDSRNQDA